MMINAYHSADLSPLLIAEHEILYEPHSTLRTPMTRMPGLEGEIVPGTQ